MGVNGEEVRETPFLQKPKKQAPKNNPEPAFLKDL
jgi:hypothetical protein